MAGPKLTDTPELADKLPPHPQALALREYISSRNSASAVTNEVAVCEKLDDGKAADIVRHRIMQLEQVMFKEWQKDKKRHYDFNHVTVAAGIAWDTKGCAHRMISLSSDSATPEVLEPYIPYITEEYVDGPDHAEVNIIKNCLREDWELGPIGATRYVCASCQGWVRVFGGPRVRVVTCISHRPPEPNMPVALP